MKTDRVVALVRLSPLVAVLFCSGCAKRETRVEEGNRTATLHVGNGEEPGTLDPQIASGIGEENIVKALFEGLLVPDPINGEPAPGIAKSWDVSPDGKIYTFHLRPDARWSDGRVVTAEDFVRSAKRVLTPALGAEASTFFMMLAGARDYYEKRESDFGRVGIRALDPATLQVSLVEPTTHFLTLVAGGVWLPVPVEVVARFGGIDKRDTPWARPGNLVGNGPFVLKKWQPNALIVVEKSPTYWDRANVKLERICFYPTDNADAEEKMFRAGQLHLTATLPPSKVEGWHRTDSRVLHVEPQTRLAFLVVNVQRAPFSDVRVRRALALALNRTQLAKAIGGERLPTRSFSPPDGVGFEPTPQFQEDRAEARRLLAEAGFPSGRGFPKIEALLANQGVAQPALEVVQETWRTQLGIETTLRVEELNSAFASEIAGKFDVSYDYWLLPHVQLFFDTHRTGNSFSHYFWSHADYDRLLGDAARAATIAERNAVYVKLEAILAREMPVIPLYLETSVFLMQPNVHGWHANGLNLHPWKFISLEAAQ